MMESTAASDQLQREPVKIAELESWIVRVPTIRAHALSMATMSEQRMVLVKVTASNGLVGWGEASTIGGLAYSDESPDSIKLTLDQYFRDQVIGCTIFRPAVIMQQVRGSAVGNYFAKNALETALLDLLSRQLDVPLSVLLGGRLVDRLPVAWTLASGDTDADIEEGRAMLERQKHNIFKLKVGKRSWAEDGAHIGAIADAFTGEASIRIDVNQAWDLTTAKKALPALAEMGVDLVEQPIAAHDIDGAAELRRLDAVPIMADESLRGGVNPAFRTATHRAADVLSLKIAQAGGLHACREVAALAGAAGLGLYGGTMLEGPIGTIASAQLFATLPELSWGTELFGPLLLTEDILTKPLEYKNYHLEIPSGGGLGIEIDEEKLSAVAE